MRNCVISSKAENLPVSSVICPLYPHHLAPSRAVSAAEDHHVASRRDARLLVLKPRKRATATTRSASSGAQSAPSYSRSSWRAAILNETDRTEAAFTPDARAEDSSFAAAAERHQIASPHPPSISDGTPAASRAWSTAVNGGSSQAERADAGEGAANGTLSSAELRVKLSLAAGSGRLDLTDCRLRALPPEVLELTELEELQLSGNCLVQLPEGISRLTALRRLGLAGNLLTSLPEGLGALAGLEGLWLHGNLLASLPPQLGRLGGLRALSLAGNCIESIPPGALSGLTSLTDLTLAGNRLTRLPPRELAPLVRLRKLALNGNLLASQPPGELGLGPHMTALVELMLQGNRLTEADPAIFECPALAELSLADNLLTCLPARLAAATSLARLHLFGNQLYHLPTRQLAALPSLASCWLEGNPLSGQAVGELLEVAGGGGMPRLKALGLDQRQVAGWRAAAAEGGAGRGLAGASGGVAGVGVGGIPGNVRVGCVLGSGPGYFKLQYGKQRGDGSGSGAGTHVAQGGMAGGDGGGGGGGREDRVRSSNDVLVVAFGSAPGTPNWGGLLSKVYRAAASEAERCFDVLYVADPSRDWYGGGDDAAYSYYRTRLAAYTRQYRQVLLLGDSMGATAALLFADLATAALAFCPQVDLTEASIRPGRPAAWLDALRSRLMASVRASSGELVVLVGTWQHDLAQANLLPPRGSSGEDPWAEDGGAAAGVAAGVGPARSGGVRVGRARAPGGWRSQLDGADGAQGGRVVGGSAEEAGGEAVAGASSVRGRVGPAAHRSPWAWQQEERGGDGGVEHRPGQEKAPTGGAARGFPKDGDGGVTVKVFSVDSHRLAAALDARGQLVSLVRDMVLHQLGMRSGNVRISNLL